MNSPSCVNKNVKTISLALAISLALSACGEGTSSAQGEQFGTPDSPSQPSNPSNSDFNQELLLASVVDKVIVPTYNSFAQQAADQTMAINTYCSSVADGATDTSVNLQAAQQSWGQAMQTWQMAEVMQIGPLVENNATLRNKIYSWPNVSSCSVDQDVVLAELDDYDITTRTASRKGMDALEYLLFNDNLDHSCTLFGTEPEGWNNRSNQDRQLARCQFAELVAADVERSANQLLSAWSGEQGYAMTLKQAGQQDSVFADVHDAVNDISDALFYIDSSTKDAKIATPLGLFANDCGLEPCVANLESQYASYSMANIIANIHALNLIYRGGEDADSIGFDDYLVDVGDASTAIKMRDDLATVIEFANGLEGSMHNLLNESPEQVEQLHSQVKAVTDSLKTDFIQSLALELPQTSAGDND